eukprot:TRINITY_DN392_c1_g1_i2.p1 TRINITY_DN392_c1_g1~~TRINITY_DN392_c1_g1_i2.p1  ORF type:complete len:583 (+),score=103.07 TRINITY_DN392_c1_g1_i2:89-1837(+)
MGWLTKEGHVWTSWQQRWMVLVGQQIMYFEKKPTSPDQLGITQKGVVQLRGARIDAVAVPGRQFTFKITNTPDRKDFLMSAPTEHDMNEWIAKVRQVAGGQLPVPQMMPSIPQQQYGSSPQHGSQQPAGGQQQHGQQQGSQQYGQQRPQEAAVQLGAHHQQHQHGQYPPYPPNQYPVQQGQYSPHQGQHPPQQDQHVSQGQYPQTQYPSHEQYPQSQALQPSFVMPDVTFQQFLDQIKRANFDDERRTLIRSVTQQCFLCSQVCALLKVLNFDDERLYAVEQLAPRIADPQSHFTIVDVFTFGDQKAKAEHLLSRFRTPAMPMVQPAPQPLVIATSVPAAVAADVVVAEANMIAATRGMQAVSLAAAAGTAAAAAAAVTEAVAVGTTDVANETGLPATGGGHMSFAANELAYGARGPQGVPIAGGMLGASAVGANVTWGAAGAEASMLSAATAQQQGYFAQPQVAYGTAPPQIFLQPTISSPAASGMPGGSFSALCEQIRRTAFGDERRTIIRSAADTNFFTCEQLAAIFKLLPFEDERMDAGKAIASRIVDHQNHFVAVGALTFGSEKKKLEKILAKRTHG